MVVFTAKACLFVTCVDVLISIAATVPWMMRICLATFRQQLPLPLTGDVIKSICETILICLERIIYHIIRHPSWTMSKRTWVSNECFMQRFEISAALKHSVLLIELTKYMWNFVRNNHILCKSITVKCSRHVNTSHICTKESPSYEINSGWTLWAYKFFLITMIWMHAEIRC